MGTTYGETVLEDSPSSYWRLGESSGSVAFDEVDTRHGTYINAPTLGVSGAPTGDPDTAAGFDAGAAQYVDMGDVLDVNGGSFSAECWFKTTTGSSQRRLVNKRGPGALGAAAGFRLSWSGGLWDATFLEDTAGRLARIPSAVTFDQDDGEWHHAVLTWDATTGTLVLYIDAVNIGEVTNAAMIDADCSSSASFQVARTSDSSSYYFDGTLDEIAWYPHALSPERIEAHHDAGLGIFPDPPPPGPATGSGLGDYLEDSLRDHVLRGVTFDVPGTVYLHLFTAEVGDNDAGPEVAGGSYAAQPVPFDAAGTGFAVSGDPVQFLDVPAATVTHAALKDAAGNLLMHAPLHDEINAAAGDTITFLPAAIDAMFS